MKPKHKSNYSLRLDQRKRAGDVRYVLTVDSKGNATLNKAEFVTGPDGRPKTRTFTRLYRKDEIV
jgi:hypothetical protein